MENQEKHICENCGKEHDGSYGSGRFCCYACKQSYSSKKVKNRSCNYIHKSKDDGWTCKCGLNFRTRILLRIHKKECNQYGCNIHGNSKIYKCKYCGSGIYSRKKYYDHLRVCNEKLKFPHDSLGRIINKNAGKNAAKTRSELAKKGLLVYKGHPISDKQKERLRILAIERKGFSANYNKKACEFINDLNTMFNWNLQHAENGGEIIIGGYFLDGYDKKLNIAFEYDERKHYFDVNENVLKEKDYMRMSFIHTKTNCRFFRYNETLNLLYEVTNFDFVDVIYTAKSKHSIRKRVEKQKIKRKRIKKERNIDKELFIKENMVRSDGVFHSKMIPLSVWERRKEIIINSGIDISKFGWVGKMEKVTGMSKRIIEAVLIHYKSEFEGKYFRRKLANKLSEKN